MAKRDEFERIVDGQFGDLPPGTHISPALRKVLESDAVKGVVFRYLDNPFSPENVDPVGQIAASVEVPRPLAQGAFDILSRQKLEHPRRQGGGPSSG